MEFAKDLLAKYGWEEGKGLGRNEDGISSAIIPKLKFDNAGVGHNRSEEFTNNWWDRLYSQASSNINVQNTVDGKVEMNRVSKDAIEITNKDYSIKDFKSSNDLEYGSFVKTSKLIDKGIISLNINKKYGDSPLPQINVLSDAELFAVCGGRTAHKGARHGLKLSGKLSRLEKQERLLLKKLKTVSLSDDVDTKQNKKSLNKKLKKLNDHKERDQLKVLDESSSHSLASSPSSSCSGKKRRKPKRVSFSETVTEYQRPEQDSDLGSRPTTPINSTVKQVKIKEAEDDGDLEPAAEPDQYHSADEGIDCCDDIRSKIRQEHRMMKRTLKMLRRNRTDAPATHVSPPQMALNLDTECFSMKCLKRKIGVAANANDSKRYHYEDGPETGGDKGKVQTLSKRQLKKLKKEKKMRKKINKMAQSLNDQCKIGDSI